MKHFATILLLMISLIIYSQRDEYNIDTLKIKSEILQEDRVAFIYKPQEISNTNPITFLYLLEGEESDGIYKEIRHRFNDSIPNLVVVGIVNPERRRDMLYINGASKFLEFICSELIPAVEKDYRTPMRILHGHSFCGSFTVYTLINDPECFDYYFASSPVPLVNMVEKELYLKLDSLSTGKVRFYFSYGSKDMKQVRKYSEVLRKNLEGTEFKNLDWEFKLFPGKSHFNIYMEALFWGLDHFTQ
jgi:predicted alpha/beta superfamily hydrolase